MELGRYMLKLKLLMLLILIIPVHSIAGSKILLWGDTHLHTNNSVDAYLSGNETISPHEAYKFARGEYVLSSSGKRAKLSRPLDFLVVADHAEYYGLLPELQHRSAGLSSEARSFKRGFWGGVSSIKRRLVAELTASLQGDSQKILDDRDLVQSRWMNYLKVSEEFNQPGRFSTLMGFEWSSMEGGDNLHRVVIFSDGLEKLKNILPFSALDSSDVRKLWEFMGGYEKSYGGKVLAIPHNGNLSNGLMFSSTVDGVAMTESYAQLRNRWEPLYEITQMKGDSETHPLLSKDDGLADYETWDKGNINGNNLKQPSMLEYEYARPALKNGLKIERRLKVNPFEFGFVGGTDSHTGLAAVEEDNYWGKVSFLEPKPNRSAIPIYKSGAAGKVYDLFARDFSAAGYTAVWAEFNDRKSIFAALTRKEVYATTGSRITLRFFSGVNLRKDYLARPGWTDIAEKRLVTMGGQLLLENGSSGPSFAVSVTKDPVGANLDRVQIVKVWLDGENQALEKVFDLAGKGRNCPKKLSVECTLVWEDHTYQNGQQALYYVRVIEEPSLRWDQLDALAEGNRNASKRRENFQERAYSSPIWVYSEPKS